MPQGYDGLPNFYTASSNPITANLGLSLKGCDPIVAENFYLVDTAFGSGGTSVEVNGSVVNSPNFNGTTPSAPVGNVNVIWQVSGSSVSAYVPVSSGTPGWSDLQNATGALTLANGANATTFNQTSAVNWTWANTTAATNLGVNQNSPLLNIAGTCFISGASAVDNWAIQNVIPAGHTSSTVTNIAETAGNVVTLTITGGNFAVGDVVTFTGLTAGYGDWLNGTNQTLTAASATSLTFTDSTAHGSLASHATSGQVTQAAPSRLTFAHSGTAGESSISIPTGGISIYDSYTDENNYERTRIWSNGGNLTIGKYKAGTGSSSGQLVFGTNDHYITFYTDWASGVTLTEGWQITSGNLIPLGAGNALNLGGTSGGVVKSLYLGTSIIDNGSGLAVTDTFAPVYGTTAYGALRVTPTINQAAVTDTIAGVQVTGGNLVTLVFADTTATFTNGATTLTVAAVTNTTVNGSGNTIASYVRRTGITVVTNSAEVAVTNVVTLSMANTGSMATNDYVSITGLTVATWLNGKVVKLTGVSANVSITFVDPTGHGLKTSGAEGGGVVICHYLTYSKTISNITLGSDTGTATQQATGAYTALQIAVTETALGGTPNYLINALAGAAGTTQVFAVDNLGAMYLAKAAAGAPTSVGTAGTIGQIIRYGGVLYFCSVTGAAGSATWNSLNMTAV